MSNDAVDLTQESAAEYRDRILNLLYQHQVDLKMLMEALARDRTIQLPDWAADALSVSRQLLTKSMPCGITRH
jgi:hypothetical protein